MRWYIVGAKGPLTRVQNWVLGGGCVNMCVQVSVCVFMCMYVCVC